MRFVSFVKANRYSFTIFLQLVIGFVALAFAIVFQFPRILLLYALMLKLIWSSIPLAVAGFILDKNKWLAPVAVILSVLFYVTKYFIVLSLAPGTYGAAR